MNKSFLLKMDIKESISKSSKFEKTCFVNRIYGTWLLGLYYIGMKRDLELAHLYKSPNSDRSEILADQLEKNWNQNLKRKSPSFTRATLKSFGEYMIPSFVLFMFEECFLRNIQALMLANVIHFFAHHENDDYVFACLNAAGVAAASLFYVLCHHPACYNAVRVAIKIRVAWCTLLYRKLLRLDICALNQATSGQVMNLISNDVNRLDEYCLAACYTIVAPIQACISMFILYTKLGSTCLIGLAILLFFIPLNSFTGRIFSKVRAKAAVLTDIRIQLIKEIIRSMRMIKMYAWESKFLKIISNARRKEISQIRYATFLRAMNMSISEVSGRIILFSILVSYAAQGHILNADSVFVAMTLLHSVHHNMTWVFPNSIGLLYEVFISSKRIQTFLLLEEANLKDEVKPNSEIINQPNQNFIIVDHVSASWNLNQTPLALDNISISIQRGEFLTVVGSVGSGKSAFLMMLMNELKITSGSLKVNGKISYAPQDPWVFNGTVQENILFGQELNEQKFAQVIRACALDKDIQEFPLREKTLVGERGVSLSFGQKSRVNLARALYLDADIYLLDDPFSSVDLKVAQQILRGIEVYLRSKTVVLVIHNLKLLKQAKLILLMENGKQLKLGTYEEIEDSKFDLLSIIGKRKCNNKYDSNSYSNTSTVLDVTNANYKDFIHEPQIAVEEKKRGPINGSVYLQYIKAGSGPILISLMMLTTIASQFLFYYTDIWLSYWTNQAESQLREHLIDNKDNNNNLITYSILIIAQFGAMLLRSVTFFTICLNASINLHKRVLYHLIHVPISFFDKTPVGRILNRFVKDMGTIDEQLPLIAFDLNLVIAELIGTAIVLSVLRWYFIFPAFILMLVILFVRHIYMKTARDLKRFEAILRSPIYDHLSITMNGLSTIRAFKAQSLFENNYYKFQNDHTATYFLYCTSSRLLGLCLDLFCSLYVFSIACLLMLFPGEIQSGTAGLILSMAISLTGMAQWGIRQSTELENQMISVERLTEYCKLENENYKPHSISNKILTSNWIQFGNITFDHVHVFYENSPYAVLKDICVEIKGGENIGIIGRTGSGKSTLIAALYRMAEVKGKIIIDGFDCSRIDLIKLRSKMSIIPQEPMIFADTIRKNIDPFGEHSDMEMWSALEQVQLKNFVKQLPDELSHKLIENGANLSVGQRQLICLARALIRQSQILILDEATANVDLYTAKIIHEIISCSFSKCTVLNISHHFSNIIDYDKIMVLDGGKLVQYDTPLKLLQDKMGKFYKQAKNNDPETLLRFYKIALENTKKKKYLI